MTLLFFSGCGYISKDDLIFCKSKLHDFSNATEIKHIYNQHSYIGCSDGKNIAWYTKDKFILTLYESETQASQINK